MGGYVNQHVQRAGLSTSERIFQNDEKKFSSEWDSNGNESDITHSFNYTSQRAKEPHWMAGEEM